MYLLSLREFNIGSCPFNGKGYPLLSTYIVTSKKLKMLRHHKNIAGWTLTSMSICDAPYFPPLEQLMGCSGNMALNCGPPAMLEGPLRFWLSHYLYVWMYGRCRFLGNISTKKVNLSMNAIRGVIRNLKVVQLKRGLGVVPSAGIQGAEPPSPPEASAFLKMRSKFVQQVN